MKNPVYVYVIKCNKNKNREFKNSKSSCMSTFSKPQFFLQFFFISAEISVELFPLDIRLFLYSSIVF